MKGEDDMRLKADNLEELKANWHSIRDNLIRKIPYIEEAMTGREIKVQDRTVILPFEPAEYELKRTVQIYLGFVYEAIRDYLKKEFRLEVVTVRCIDE